MSSESLLNISIGHVGSFVMLFALFLYIITFSIILFIKNKEAFISFYTGIIMLSVFFAYMFHKHTLFHVFTFNHFITIFLFVLIFFSVGFGIIGIATIDDWI